MSFQKQKTTETPASLSPLATAEVIVKLVVFAILLGVGLKLTFWAVGVVDQLLHRPEEIAIVRPLLQTTGDTPRSLLVESTDDGLLIQDQNALTLVVLLSLLAVLFAAIGRAIAALIGSSIKVLASVDFSGKRRGPETERGGSP